MKLLKRVKHKIFKLLYALPFSMKVGEMLNTSESDNESSISQNVESGRLSDALLKGVVTKQVEELRYRDYKVAEESRKYKYIGNGIAIKEKNENTSSNIKFIQNNRQLCSGVLDELKRVDEKIYGIDTYTLNILYDDITRFKLEKYCLRFMFESTKESSSLVLYFDSLPDVYDKTSKSFINELEGMQGMGKPSNVFKSVKQVIFVTSKVNGEKDFVRYTLSDLKIESWGKDEQKFYVKYSVGVSSREDLTEKFKSDELESRYEQKAPKETSSMKNVTLDLKKYKCSECGTLISDTDAMISYEVMGKRLCTKCWERYLLSEK